MKTKLFARMPSILFFAAGSVFSLSTLASDVPHHPGCGNTRQARLKNWSCHENTVCRAPRTKSFKAGFTVTSQVDDSFAGPTGDQCTNCTLNEIPIEGNVTLPPGANPKDYKVVTFLRPANDIWYIQPDNKVVLDRTYPDGSKSIETVMSDGTDWGQGISNNSGSGPQYSYSEIENNGYFKTHINLKQNVRYSSVAFALIEKGSLLKCNPSGEAFFRDYIRFYNLVSVAQSVYDFGCFNKVPGQK